MIIDNTPARVTVITENGAFSIELPNVPADLVFVKRRENAGVVVAHTEFERVTYTAFQAVDSKGNTHWIYLP